LDLGEWGFLFRRNVVFRFLFSVGRFIQSFDFGLGYFSPNVLRNSIHNRLFSGVWRMDCISSRRQVTI